MIVLVGIYAEREELPASISKDARVEGLFMLLVIKRDVLDFERFTMLCHSK